MTSLPAPAVLAVLDDLGYWNERGVRIVMVEPAADGGAKIAVLDGVVAAGDAFRLRYAFPVECWRW